MLLSFVPQQKKSICINSTSKTLVIFIIYHCINNNLGILTHARTHARTHAHTYIHAYIHIYMHACIHTYIHTRNNIHRFLTLVTECRMLDLRKALRFLTFFCQNSKLIIIYAVIYFSCVFNLYLLPVNTGNI